jgi:predicted nucleic-acid-binding Zn-ribbon protein
VAYSSAQTGATGVPDVRGVNMKNGRCPKCGSTTIHSKSGGIGFAQQTSVYVYDAGSRWAKPAPLVAYVCTSCGFFEVYMNDSGVLGDVAGAWSQVAPT